MSATPGTVPTSRSHRMTPTWYTSESYSVTGSLASAAAPISSAAMPVAIGQRGIDPRRATASIETRRPAPHDSTAPNAETVAAADAETTGVSAVANDTARSVTAR